MKKKLENDTNNLEKNGTEINRPEKDHQEFIKTNKLILKIQQRFKSERYNVFTEEVNQIVLSSNDNKRMQSTDLKETCI